MKIETVSYETLPDYEKVALRALDLLNQEPTPEDFEASKEYLIKMLACRDGDLVEREVIPDLWEATPAQLVRAVFSWENSRLDWVMSRFPRLRDLTEGEIRKLLPDIEGLAEMLMWP